ncbi:hypothetical protein PanWU01x14_370310, partial [Parasponia andersonii]
MEQSNNSTFKFSLSATTVDGGWTECLPDNVFTKKRMPADIYAFEARETHLPSCLAQNQAKNQSHAGWIHGPEHNSSQLQHKCKATSASLTKPRLTLVLEFPPQFHFEIPLE